MKSNRKPTRITTHEGAPAKRITSELQLRRSVMACLLWEQSFYEDGVDIAERISKLIPKVPPEKCMLMAIEAREKMKLRHMPLFIARVMAQLVSHRGFVAATLDGIIQRADELSEFVAIYWKDKRQALSAQVKKGLARVFVKFSEYQLAKYNRDGAVKLRDVLFLCHAKPSNKVQEKTWKKLIDGTLPIPDTWETELSAGRDKKETFARLIQEGKLGAMALLRNLRNMQEAGVRDEIIRDAIAVMKTDRVLPFRFISAARYAPSLEDALEGAMMGSLKSHEKLTGKTVLLIDTSGSMVGPLSSKSTLNRLDAACGLAILLREICENVDIFAFTTGTPRRIPTRHGFALRDAIGDPDGGTELGAAVRFVNTCHGDYDRLIVMTDEQSCDPVGNPCGRGYMINVGSYENGVGYGHSWIHIDGFSEAIVDYIAAYEKSGDKE
jgi:hypothetical protein